MKAYSYRPCVVISHIKPFRRNECGRKAKWWNRLGKSLRGWNTFRSNSNNVFTERVHPIKSQFYKCVTYEFILIRCDWIQKKNVCAIYHILSFIRWNESVFDPFLCGRLIEYKALELKINGQYQEIDKKLEHFTVNRTVSSHSWKLSTKSNSRMSFFNIPFKKWSSEKSLW